MTPLKVKGKTSNQLKGGDMPKNITNEEGKTMEGLSKTINSLRDEVKELSKYKEMWRESQILIERLDKQLSIKRDVLRVVIKKDGVPHLAQITKVMDTPEGMIIEGKL